MGFTGKDNYVHFIKWLLVSKSTESTTCSICSITDPEGAHLLTYSPMSLR